MKKNKHIKKESDSKKEENSEDDDLQIDFKPITKFFKGMFSEKDEKKENHKETKKDEESKKDNSEDDDLEIDFKPIKKFFTSEEKSKDKHKKHKEENEESSEDIDLNFAPTINFIKEKKAILLPISLILIAIFFSVFLRMVPADLPITDAWAKSTVENYYRNQIISSINQQYPNLPDQNKNNLANTELQKFMEQNKDMVKQQTEGLSQNFKSNYKYTVNGKEYIYLSDIDTYVWYGEAKNYLKNGHFGTEYVDGVSMNMLRNGREGLPSNLGAGMIHMYMEVYLYKFMHFFNSNIQLTSIVFVMSVIIITLSVIPAFFIGKMVGGNIGGFFAAMIVAVNPSLLARTAGGVADTDPWNIFFPLMIMWMFLEAFEAKDWKKQVIYSIAAGLFVGLFGFTWGGWWYTFDFIIVMIGIYFAYLIIIKLLNKENISKQLKDLMILTSVFIISSFLFVTLFVGFTSAKGVVTGPLGVILMKDVGIQSLWPNVLTTVAEFNTVPLSQIIGQMGGNILFFLALIGIVLLLYNQKKNDMLNNIYLVSSIIYYLILIFSEKNLNNPMTFMILISIPIAVGLLKVIYNKENKNIDIKIGVLIIIWFMGTAYGFTKGIRFGILMVPAFAIAVGAGVGIIYEYLCSLLHKELEINKLVSNILIALLFCILLISQVKSSYAVAKSEMPMMNDAWYDTLTAIKDNSTDAMISSWWDFGHWFVAISERRVTSDGADQGERIHWVGKSLLTSDEETSTGILRMLNCGQEKAPHIIEKYLNEHDNNINPDKNTVVANNILNSIIVENRNKAEKILKKEGFNDEEITEILKTTHCDNLILPHYMITSEDMVGKSGVWAHFGSWDFNKAHMFNDIINNKDKGIEILKNDFNMTQKDAEKTFFEITTMSGDQWISPWPSYMSGETGCQKKDNETLICSNGLMVNLTDYDSWVPTKDGELHPKTLVYTDNESFYYKEYDKGKVLTAQNGRFIGVALLKNGESYYTIMMDDDLSRSMFTRLFYFEGVGLEKYHKFYDKTDITGQRIITWTVDIE